MEITPTQLRKDIYRLLDRVLETGEPLTVKRDGERVMIVPVEESGKKLDRLSAHDCIEGNPEDLVETDWSHLWNDREIEQ